MKDSIAPYATAVPTSFVFWQDAPNHLQAPWLSALAERCGVRVRVALESGDVGEWRRRLGWQVPDYGAATLEKR